MGLTNRQVVKGAATILVLVDLDLAAGEPVVENVARRLVGWQMWPVGCAHPLSDRPDGDQEHDNHEHHHEAHPYPVGAAHVIVVVHGRSVSGSMGVGVER